ncbi:MAG: aminotransferase class V-fold PLP-dependent enzyme, partial [Clostridia bacterium]|nr:aminotransferase class V-fold PLP-dependent enzyme [Clostridia bacterium]
MENIIYLDNSATTKPCATSVNKTIEALEKHWGNPSSLYQHGIEAETVMENAREKTAELLGCRSDEIFFTSGGTEANNLCIRGAAERMKRRGNRIVTTSIEHPSVLNTCESLEALGFEIVKIKPESDGYIDFEKVKSAINDKTILV